MVGPSGDADLALVDLGSSAVLRAEDLQYRHKQSPYVGRALRERIVRTLVRGFTVWLDGKVVSEPVGRFRSMCNKGPGGGTEVDCRALGEAAEKRGKVVEPR